MRACAIPVPLKNIDAAWLSSAWSRNDAGAIAVQLVGTAVLRGAGARCARGMSGGCTSIRSPTATWSIGMDRVATGRVVWRCVRALGGHRTLEVNVIVRTSRGTTLPNIAPCGALSDHMAPDTA